MSAFPPASDRFEDLLLAHEGQTLRVTWGDGDVFRLRSFYVLPPSIYGLPDQWSAEVVERVAGRHSDSDRLYPPGSGLDFIESEIIQISEDATGAILFARDESA